MGTIVIGKVESGGTKKGDQLLVMPNKVILVIVISYHIGLHPAFFYRPTSRWSRSGLMTSRSLRSPRARTSRSRSKASTTATCLQDSSSAAPSTPSPREKCLMPRYLDIPESIHCMYFIPVLFRLWCWTSSQSCVLGSVVWCISRPWQRRWCQQDISNIIVIDFVSQVTIKALICLVDRKTGDKSKTRPRFIKQDQIAIVR